MSFCGAIVTNMWDLFLLHGGTMGNNSTQGWAVLILMLAFTFLSISLFYGGSILFLVLAVASLAGAISLFRKAKELENRG